LYRLIASDVDKTLLDNESRMTELNRNALIECKKRDIGIVLATGKTMDSILHLVEDLGLELPQITLNGSVTISPKMEVIRASKIDPGTYREIVSFIKENGYPPVVALDDGKLYIEEYHPDLKHLDKIGEEFIEVKSIETDRFYKNTVDIYIPILESHPLDRSLRDKYSDRLQFMRSGDYFFDILNKEATKGNALLSIIEDLGIKRDEVAVFGDSPNDLSMFEVAGLKIAVRNSYPEVLERADIITDESFNSGLGKAIFKYILKDP
jgi:Cof subfamily protein (haloacid dehalogenase superfamily)